MEYRKGFKYQLDEEYVEYTGITEIDFKTWLCMEWF